MKIRIYATTIVFCIIFSCSLMCLGQTSISGIINTYTKVTAITNCSCPTTNCANITVSSTAGFSAGDRVLIIQMKGASVDMTNTESHGSITALNDAGNYEFADVASVAGSIITTSLPLKETYFTGVTPADSAYVQLVRVPVYPGDVNVIGTLTAQAWNGTTGGVLAFEAAGNVTLSANINTDGLGFRKAKRQTFSIACGADTAYYYQSTAYNYSSCTSCGYLYDDVPTRVAEEAAYGGCGSPCFTNRMSVQDPKLGGYRGEGIAANLFTKTFVSNGLTALFDKGKGKWANGGGGGGNHNAGGGGGGNGGKGGFGGKAFNSTACPAGTHEARRGRGAVNLTPTATKIFMGGGGGEGHDNGGSGSTGTNGGAIIIIKANSIINSGAFTISSNGIDNTSVSNGDGQGGGGAGGTILLDVATFTNAITISAKGGKGGDHSNANCHGTGGGGGGGVIWYQSSCTPANVTSNVAGGINGRQTSPSPDCGPQYSDWGATPGAIGLIKCGLGGGATVFLNTMDCGTLPVNLLSFTGSFRYTYISLTWQTASEENSDRFEIERSSDGYNFYKIGSVNAAKNSTQLINYNFPDYNIDNIGSNHVYYRLKQVDMDGAYIYSGAIVVKINSEEEINFFPNPVKAGNPLHVSIGNTSGSDITVKVTDLLGKIVYAEILPGAEELMKINISTTAFSKGAYILSIMPNNDKAIVRKFFVE